MTKFYGSLICPDCVEAKDYFEKVNFKYEFIDITKSTINLKEFLKLRDNREEFKEIKKEGYIGIPAILKDDDTLVLGDKVFELK